jgi:hypothetical protein
MENVTYNVLNKMRIEVYYFAKSKSKEILHFENGKQKGFGIRI